MLAEGWPDMPYIIEVDPPLHDRIRGLAEERSMPVLAFCEDVAASGGYWLACAADEIYAHQTSIVGSVGVVSASFGMTGLLGWGGAYEAMQHCDLCLLLGTNFPLNDFYP